MDETEIAAIEALQDIKLSLNSSGYSYGETTLARAAYDTTDPYAALAAIYCGDNCTAKGRLTYALDYLKDFSEATVTLDGDKDLGVTKDSPYMVYLYSNGSSINAYFVDSSLIPSTTTQGVIVYDKLMAAIDELENKAACLSAHITTDGYSFPSTDYKFYDLSSTEVNYLMGADGHNGKLKAISVNESVANATATLSYDTLGSLYTSNSDAQACISSILAALNTVEGEEVKIGYENEYTLGYDDSFDYFYCAKYNSESNCFELCMFPKSMYASICASNGYLTYEKLKDAVETAVDDDDSLEDDHNPDEDE